MESDACWPPIPEDEHQATHGVWSTHSVSFCEGNWFSLYQNLPLVNSLSAEGSTLCPLPLLLAGISLLQNWACHVYVITVSVSSWAPQSRCVWRTPFHCRLPLFLWLSQSSASSFVSVLNYWREMCNVNTPLKAEYSKVPHTMHIASCRTVC